MDIECVPTDARGEELLAERILSPRERGDASIETVQRLSIKEAAYKALVALMGKHLPLREISVAREGDAGFCVRVPDSELHVEVISSRVDGHYLSLARVQRAG